MSQSMRRSRLGLLANAGLVVLAFVLLGLVIWQKRADIRIVFRRPLDLRLLALAQVVFLFALIVTFFRWFLLVRVIEPHFPFRSTVLLGFIGHVFNLVIPGAVGGDLIKAAYLVGMRIKRTQAIASMVIDRIVGLLGLFVLASVAGAIAWQRSPGNVRNLILVAWVATGLGVLLLAAIFGQVLTRLFPQLGAGHPRFRLIVRELQEMSATYRGRLDVVLYALLLSMFNHSLSVVAFYLIGWMLYPNLDTTLAQHFLMVPLTLFTMAVPLPFGALGLTEEVGEQLLRLVGHPGGALATIGFRIVLYGGGLVGACVYLAKLKEVRELTASAHHLEEELSAGDLGDETAGN
jgi:uncharacterized protein (TIRG00374 family)